MHQQRVGFQRQSRLARLGNDIFDAVLHADGLGHHPEGRDILPCQDRFGFSIIGGGI